MTAWRPAAGVEVRDSKDVAGPVLSFPPAAWPAFIDDTRAARLR